VSKILLTLPEENQKRLETLKIKLGLSIEISKEISEPIKEMGVQRVVLENERERGILEGVKVSFPNVEIGKKLTVKDFTTYFRNRFNDMRNILQEHSELKNLVSINKISGDRNNVSIIGLVGDKRITKNKNILFEVEDLGGKMKVLINQKNKELVEKAEEISLDSVIGFSGSANKEILFANNVVFPDSMLVERKKSPVEEYVLILGDLHFGSKLFLKENFLKFIDYLNGKVPNTPEVEKIKYLIFAGDVVTGVGNYPDQEMDLIIPDLEEQYLQLADLLKKIRSDIKIIITSGNHDGVRLMEPQPAFDKKYAWPLYELKNVILSGNPSTINLGAKESFSGFNILIYHGYSFPYYVGTISKLILANAMNSPELIMKYLLKQRHLAPSHTSTQYFPSEKDSLIFMKMYPIYQISP